jgi:hypothetical protein
MSSEITSAKNTARSGEPRNKLNGRLKTDATKKQTA